jgi:hypothetical protein
MLRPLLVTLSKGTSVASEPTPLLSTLDTPPPSFPIVCFFVGLFDTSSL